MQSSRLTRARVNERLERAVRFPVTLVVAPAGFGKSVALRDFLQRSGMQSVRYDVRREDETLLAFVRRLSEALEPVCPSALAAFPAMQERVLAAEQPVRQLSDWFVEHLKTVACTVVIDDLHYAAVDQASIALLADLIERTDSHIKWIIATRSDVGLPIATWIAYGRMDIPIGESVLRFTTDEALAAADEAAVDIDAAEVEALRQLTEGWPVALTIALRTRTHAGDLRTASAGTREMVYRYLAEQILSGLSSKQRTFAFATSVFSAFDSGIAQALGATPEFLDELRAKVTFLNEPAPGEYRYHELFRDFLETELRRSGEHEWTAALCAGASLLERRGDEAGALPLFVKAKAAGDVTRILKRSGFALFERGEAKMLSSALTIVDETSQSNDAALLGLAAMIDAAHGRFERAERNFLAAIAGAGERTELRMALVHRYALELVRNGRDCVAFLEPYALSENMPPHLRAPLLGTLATGYVEAGRNTDAVAAAERALEMFEPTAAGEKLARAYQQGAYVQRYAGSTETARRHAMMAVDLALKNNLYELAARAYSVLYTIVHDEADDPMASLEILEKMSEYARKGASPRVLMFALITAYEIEAERGNDTALDRLDGEILQEEASPGLISTTLLPAQALRSSWSGNFAHAHDLLARYAPVQTSSEQRALRFAEIGLYAAAAGRTSDAETALAEGTLAIERSTEGRRRIIRTRILFAVAELVRGHANAAHRHLSEAERALDPRMQRLRSLTRATRVLYRVHMQQAGQRELDEALERLRSDQFGGIARLLSALPVADLTSGSALGTLTQTERELLQLLASGSSSKQIAARTGRSPYTIDTHIRSICRKLSCTGRREAVAIATSRGWVESILPDGG